jgi:hypothetical protein
MNYSAKYAELSFEDYLTLNESIGNSISIPCSGTSYHNDPSPLPHWNGIF